MGKESRTVAPLAAGTGRYLFAVGAAPLLVGVLESKGFTSRLVDLGAMKRSISMAP